MHQWRHEALERRYSAEQIRARIDEMAAEIRRTYAELEGELVLVSMLRGSLYFMADLSRALDLPLEYDFIQIAYHGDGEGSVRLAKDLETDIRGKHVLVLEEIMRTGLTTNYMIQELEQKSPTSLRLAVLFHNEDQLLMGLEPDFVGFSIDWDELCGYGMDCQGQGRNLPYVCTLDEAALDRART